ncbi:uncharacterized protein [Anas platyrhynchos]|uniref:uncharacterized protein n=1 Tax=Anas platyrhynchos TaxID=8839 RepID=UPI003AF271C0
MGPTGAVLAGTGYSTPQLDVVHGPQGNPTEVSPGRALPDPRLFPALKPSWSPRGPLRRKGKADLRKASPASSDIIEDIVKELAKAAPGIARETVPKEVLWKLNSRTLPLPGKRAKAAQATATPGVDENKAKTTEPPNYRRYCIEGAAAFLVPLLLGTVACCVLIRRWRQKNRRLAAAQAAQSSLRPSRRPEHRERPESQARRQQPPAVPGRPARLPPARPPRPPRPPQQWKARDRPSAPQASWARTPPPRPPPPSFKGWGTPPRGAAWGNY